MPVISQGDPLPDWSELRHFEIVSGEEGAEFECEPVYRKLILVVVEGTIDVEEHCVLGARDIIEINGSAVAGHFVVSGVFVALQGIWDEDTGGVGVFDPEHLRINVIGDPVWYEKNTAFDNHYHDCDEFWIIVSGRGAVVSEGEFFNVVPGACVATRMGDHHDFPVVHEPVTAVYFETTLHGPKRRGHLWEHSHGPAPVRY